MEDLKDAIEIVRNDLFDEELDQFERVIDRLEGYEIAYKTILQENERMKNELEKYSSLNKVKTVSELRKVLALKTAPNHGLVDLYKRGVADSSTKAKKGGIMVNNKISGDKTQIDKLERYENILKELKNDYLHMADWYGQDGHNARIVLSIIEKFK